MKAALLSWVRTIALPTATAAKLVRRAGHRFASLAAGLSLAIGACAHETWLLPSTFEAKPGQAVRFEAATGMAFPAFDAPVRASRVAAAADRLGGRRTAWTGFDPKARSLAIVRTFEKPGVVAAWMSLGPKPIRLSDDKVAEYLDEIGAGDALRRRWAAQKGRVPWSETYTKHAKTFVSVGAAAGDDSWRVPVGLPLEIVPVGDPSSAQADAPFAVRILRDGVPLPGLPLGIVFAGDGARTFRTSDADGTAVFPLARAGVAMVFAIDLRPEGDGPAWRSDFTTMTFRVPGP